MADAEVTDTGFYLFLKAEQSCGGCSGSITRILKKIDTVGSVHCNVENNLAFAILTEDVDDDGKDKMVGKLGKWAKNAKKELSQVDKAGFLEMDGAQDFFDSVVTSD